VLADTPDYKWESTRGVGFSFGYNRNEGDEHHLKAVELVRSFVDVVSKGGNLLLNVGPMADGTIPALQGKRLEVLGNWLAVNGEAVYGARPWQRAEGKTAEGVAVRFTTRGKSLYICLMDRPSTAQVRLAGVTPWEGSEVSLLGVARPLPWRVEGGDLVVDLPTLSESPVYVLKAAAG